MGVEKDEGCFKLKVDPWGWKQTGENEVVKPFC